MNSRRTRPQIRQAIRDKLGIIVRISVQKTLCCDPTLETSPRDGSNDGSQHIF